MLPAVPDSSTARNYKSLNHLAPAPEAQIGSQSTGALHPFLSERNKSNPHVQTIFSPKNLGGGRSNQSSRLKENANTSVVVTTPS